MKNSFALACLLFCGCTLFAQTRNPAVDINRANIWHFGAQSGPGTFDAPSLHFENGTPYVINIGPGATVSTICDSLGSLQITGGNYKLYNKTLATIKNGTGVIGDNFISIQHALAVPKPNEPNSIYYFTVPRSLKYNLVDMSSDSGRGEIIEKNITIYPYPPGVEAKIAAVHHCNGKDVWVMTHRLYTDSFLAFLVTDTGITATPVISEIGPRDDVVGSAEQGGNIKFSPNGKKLAIAFSNFAIPSYLLDFDNSTGTVTNPVRLHQISGAKSISFSPDNSKLYIGTLNGVLTQYNIQAGDSTDIYNSRKIIDQFPASLFNMQIGRDSKIYVAQASPPYSTYLGVINNPNASDTLCDFNRQGVNLSPAYLGWDGLMNTVESYFYTGSSAFPCYGDTATIDCNDNNVCTEDSYHPATGCVYSPVTCDDSDSCTVDACDSFTGCFYTPVMNCTNGLVAITGEIYVRVFPNPFTNEALIKISGVKPIKEKVEYQLLDALGKEVNLQFSEIRSSTFEVNAILHGAKLNAGLYFLTVKAGSNISTIKIFII